MSDFFARMSAVLGQNVTFTTQNPEICSAKVTNDECRYSGNKPSQEAISVHIRDIKPLNGKDMTHYKELRKGMKVRLKSGRELVVDGWSENFFWAGRDSLPWARGDVV